MNGGILARCEWKKSKGAYTPCFTDRQGFASLTDWCDSCIQELASEYVTRFSSWKRVKHEATQHPMAMLRDELRSNQANKLSTPRDAAQLEKLLALEQRKVVYLQEQLSAAKRQKTVGIAELSEDNPFRLNF